MQSAARYVRDILETKLPSDITYHNIQHTESVVEAALEIGKASGIDAEELEIVELAAWFHDVGYSKNAEEHESIGAAMAYNFLVQQHYPEESARKVRDCILATKMPQSPRNKLEEIVCDADLFHLSRNDFMEKSILLRREMEVRFGKKISNENWMMGTCKFMKDHHYFTQYARANYDHAKKKNLEMAEDIYNRMKDENHKKKDKSRKAKGLDRGIETMFRLTSRNHLDLSTMA